MSKLTKLQIRKYKIGRARLFKGSEHSMYVHEDVAIGIIMQSRLSNPKMIKFRADSKINLILEKEQSVVIPLLIAFSAEKIELQHKILKNERVKTMYINMYFSERKFVAEIDEKGHIDRNQNEENKRRNSREF